MNEFSINDYSFNDYIDYEESFHDDQEIQFSYAKTYKKEAFHIVQDDINFQGESNDQAYNNFQEDNLPYTGSHDDDYEIIQKNSIQKDSLFHTESHEEVQVSHAKITKRRSPKTLLIPDAAFEQASRLCVRMIFKYWDHAYLVLIAYEQQTGFVWRIQDKKLDKNGDVYNSTITKMDLKHHGHIPSPDTIHFANVYRQLSQNVMDKIKFYEFNARMSFTQRVESINSIIHKYVNSYSTLMNCFNGIQNMLSFELQKAEYHDYLKNLPFTIRSSSAVRVFSDIVDLLKLVLTDKIFRIQKAQIDICFEYYSRLIPSNRYDDFNDFDTSNCLEDHTNKCQIALKSLINCVDIEIEESITSRQIYGECAALGCKLASLAAEFRLTHVVATLQDLIQQVKQANSNSTNSQSQHIIYNPLQTKPRGRPAN
ncbi:protein far1-related sequence 5-like [Gigaspora margarita]|uniref:Protein far1-related sequence 5-like n=1 Tax=Gigaspora margarita TaxID=4874 RepID=A0A8H4EM66_GIGMA|nr:protein far1-related sequence 5-like [Gigaspora margarita]